MDKYITKQESKTPNSKKRYKKPEDIPFLIHHFHYNLDKYLFHGQIKL